MPYKAPPRKVVKGDSAQLWRQRLNMQPAFLMAERELPPIRDRGDPAPWTGDADKSRLLAAIAAKPENPETSSVGMMNFYGHHTYSF
jgi:hypothetical protein